MSESQSECVSRWVSGIQRGDNEAARQLWERYFDRIVRLARRKLGTTPRRVADEEDLAVSVFRRLCEAVERGQVADRDDLWPLLVTITTNRVIDHQRYLNPQKRGGGAVRGHSAFSAQESVADGFEQVMATEPDPEVLSQIGEEHQRLMAKLSDDLQSIANWKLESLTNEEIADHLNITSRSVRRKLERIREIWLAELEE